MLNAILRSAEPLCSKCTPLLSRSVSATPVRSILTASKIRVAGVSVVEREISAAHKSLAVRAPLAGALTVSRRYGKKIDEEERERLNQFKTNSIPRTYPPPKQEYEPELIVPDVEHEPVRKSDRLQPIEDALPDSYAVVHITGHQYKVTQGDVLLTHKLMAPVGSEIVLDKVLMLGTKDWTDFGRPLIEGAGVYAYVQEQTLTDKILIFKKKRRKGYRRMKGHRQEVTQLLIRGIKAPAKPDLQGAAAVLTLPTDPFSVPHDPRLDEAKAKAAERRAARAAAKAEKAAAKAADKAAKAAAAEAEASGAAEQQEAKLAQSAAS